MLRGLDVHESMTALISKPRSKKGSRMQFFQKISTTLFVISLSVLMLESGNQAMQSHPRLAQTFAHTKNARLKVDGKIEESFAGHVSWCLNQSESVCKNSILDELRMFESGYKRMGLNCEGFGHLKNAYLTLKEGRTEPLAGHSNWCRQAGQEKAIAGGAIPYIRLIKASLQQSSLILMYLPYVEPQDDDWSCGPNSATRFLKFYGKDVNYNMMRKVAASNLPQILRDTEAGTTPHALRDTIKPWRPASVLKRETNFDEIKSTVRGQKPVIALLRVNSIKLQAINGKTIIGKALGGLNPSMTAPALHWVVVCGIDDNSQELWIQDTNGALYPMNFDEFYKQWNWSVGAGLVKEALDAEGVTTRTIIY